MTNAGQWQFRSSAQENGLLVGMVAICLGVEPAAACAQIDIEKRCAVSSKRGSCLRMPLAPTVPGCHALPPKGIQFSNLRREELLREECRQTRKRTHLPLREHPRPGLQPLLHLLQGAAYVVHVCAQSVVREHPTILRASGDERGSRHDAKAVFACKARRVCAVVTCRVGTTSLDTQRVEQARTQRPVAAACVHTRSTAAVQ